MSPADLHFNDLNSDSDNLVFQTQKVSPQSDTHSLCSGDSLSLDLSLEGEYQVFPMEQPSVLKLLSILVDMQLAILHCQSIIFLRVKQGSVGQWMMLPLIH